MAIVDPLWVAGITAGASFLSAALGSTAGIVTTTIANRHTARLRQAELDAAAAERTAAALDARTAANRNDLLNAHVAFVTALQRAMISLRTAHVDGGSGDYYGRMDEATNHAAEAAAPLETMDVLLPPDAANAARLCFVHVSSCVATVRARNPAPEQVNEMDLRYGELRGAYTALVREALAKVGA